MVSPEEEITPGTFEDQRQRTTRDFRNASDPTGVLVYNGTEPTKGRDTVNQQMAMKATLTLSAALLLGAAARVTATKYAQPPDRVVKSLNGNTVIP